MKIITPKEYEAMTPEQKLEHLKSIREQLIEDGLLVPAEPIGVER